MAAKPYVKLLIIAKVCAHEALPELAMVWRGEMEQLVHDHIVTEVAI
jgi:hypothetical protein